MKQEGNSPALWRKRLSISPLLPLERFLLQTALPNPLSWLHGKNLAHFLSNVSSSQCSLWSLLILFSLLQHLSSKIMFYFHLVSIPPLCSQSPWHASQFLLLPMWKGKSQQGKFSSKGLSLTTHMSWVEAGKWPLNSWKSLQAAAQALGQEPCWRMIRIFPKHPCKPPQGLASSQHQSTSNGASLEQSRAKMSDLFCLPQVV